MPALNTLSAHPELNAGITTRLDELVELARDELGNDLQSVLLGGSLARGEAFGVVDEGRLRLLSDLDLYFVTSGGEGALVRRIGDWAQADDFLVTRPDVAVIPDSFFAESPDAMPTHQLAHAHRILWGEAVEIVPAAQVDAQDAAQLLFNRFVEACDPELGDGLAYYMHRTKEFIDAPMAWLGSVGEYTPERRRQVERVRELGAAWSSTCMEHLDAALNHWVACLRAREKGVVDRRELEMLAGVAGPRDDWHDWTGGFAMALLTGEGIGALHTIMRDGLDRMAMREAIRRWLHRETLPRRLRRARRWSGIAPTSVTSWRRHGVGGCGPDRIFAAACLRYHGVESWMLPLDGLTAEPTESGAELHALWLRWIQGRDDD
jgi:hypothetical protein